MAVDVRLGSPTFGKWHGEILSAENTKQYLIPRGFAHGFLVLSDTAESCYKCDEFYHANDEGGIAWDDPDIGIVWPLEEGIELKLSDKDKNWPRMSEVFKAPGGCV